MDHLNVQCTTLQNCSTQNLSNVTTNFPGSFKYTFISKYSSPVFIVILVTLSTMIIATIMGNTFVLWAICSQRALRKAQIFLIASLAVTDLMVAACVMPLSLINEVSVYWFLGNVVCDVWTTLDVLCCTASILHLVGISLDRYWSVSDVKYAKQRPRRRIVLLIASAWLFSVITSVPPLLGWKDTNSVPDIQGICVICQNEIYQIYATGVSFYCPVIIIVIINLKTYLMTKARIRNKAFQRQNDTETNGQPAHFEQITTENFETPGQNGVHEESVNGKNIESKFYACHGGSPYIFESTKSNYIINPSLPFKADTCTHEIHELGFHSANTDTMSTTCNGRHGKENSAFFHLTFTAAAAAKRKRRLLDTKRERKVARVLSILTGTFITCWLPFFVLALLTPLCGSECDVPSWLFSVCGWLGYFNSCLNPVIYIIFNPSFRDAFRKVMRRKIKS